MEYRKQSARERTGLYVLAAVLASLGGGAATAAPSSKKSSAVQKKALVSGAPKKQLGSSRKVSRKKSSAARKASRKRTASAGRQMASAVIPGGKEASLFRTDALRPGKASLPERIIGRGLNGKNLSYGKQEDEFRLSPKTDYVPTDLVRLPAEMALEKSKPIYLREEAAASLQQMIRDAAGQGVTLKVVSAYRDLAHQTRLYNSAIKRYGKGQRMVGRPGRSEHFLGTTVDVSNMNPAHLLQPSFGKSAEYRWLEANAPKYGWNFTVRAGKGGRKASQDEPWHIRYLGNPTIAIASRAAAVPPPAAAAGAEAGASGESAPFPHLFEVIRQFLDRWNVVPASPAPASEPSAGSEEPENIAQAETGTWNASDVG